MQGSQGIWNDNPIPEVLLLRYFMCTDKVKNLKWPPDLITTQIDLDMTVNYSLSQIKNGNFTKFQTESSRAETSRYFWQTN